MIVVTEGVIIRLGREPIPWHLLQQYIQHPIHLLGQDVLQLLGVVQEVVGVCLGRDPPRLGLLDEVFVALLLGEGHSILLALEEYARALHGVARRLPAHERVLPPVTLGEDIPVHAPLVALPIA